MRILLVLHVLGAVLFIGNIITAAFWKLRAEREGNPQVIASAAKQVMSADYWFTIPGIVLLLSTGHVLMVHSGYSLLSFSWISLAYGMFILTGMLWMVVLVPAQRAMIRHSKKGLLTAEYRWASHTWNLWGTIATVLPLVTLYLMVVKPF
jgi:uncharacterized membrane protein